MRLLPLATALILAVICDGADAQTFGGAYNAPVVAQTATGIAGLVGSPQPVNGIAPSCFTNPADTLASNSNWTGTSTQYLFPPASQNFLMKSIAKCATRDVEVQAWTRQGYVYERLDGSGNAIYFFMNGDNSANGYLEFGIVTGLDETSYPGGTYYPLYINNDLVHTCGCGYTNSATDGQFFTLGVSGFNIYAKYTASGVTTQFVSIQEYRQMSVGAVALKSNLGGPYGFRLFTTVPTNPPFLYSSYQTSQLDLRDFGLRSVETTGSISTSSNCLTVNSVAGFLQNDPIVVEIGGESGAGALGTVGVGGQWPQLTYATTTAMNADASQPQYTFAWVTADGLTRQWSGTNTAWSSGTTYSVNQTVTSGGINYISNVNGNIGSTPATSPTQWTAGPPANTWSTTFFEPNQAAKSYYVQKAVPMALQARISQIGVCNGANSLTLVKPDDITVSPAAIVCPSTNTTGPCATTSSANVYLDNSLTINNIVQTPRVTLGAVTPSNMTVIVAAGTFAVSGIMAVDNHPGWTIQGQGQGVTNFISPKGTFGFSISAENSPGVTLQNFTYSGNITGTTAPNGYGLSWAQGSLTTVPTSTQVIEYGPSGKILASFLPGYGNVTQTNIGGGYFQTSGLYLQSDNSTVANVTANNVFTNALSFENLTNGNASNITVNRLYQSQIYTQWQYEWANDTGGSCTNCTMNSSYYGAGPECFGANSNTSGPTWTNFVSVNAGFSDNDCGGLHINGGSITFLSGFPSPEWTISEAMLQIDNNTGSSSSGNTVVNGLALTTQANLDGSNNTAPGISITSGNNNNTIENVTYTGPGYNGGTLTAGNVALRSQGTGTTIDNLTACGTTNTGDQNIELATPGTGTIANSQWHSITTPQPVQGSGNTSC